MKKSSLLLLLCTVLAIGDLLADTETVDGITWTYIVEWGTVWIGGGSSSSTAVPKSTSGAITIPSSLGGNPVRGINSSAFYGCYALTSVTIPEGVTSFGGDAFEQCSSLTSVTIPGRLLQQGKMSSYFPDRYQFLRTIILTGTVTSIGESAFSGCKQLESVVIPNGVTTIGNLVFFGCSSLASITIPDSVSSIGYEAFYGCKGLAALTIGTNVTSIGKEAFSRCTNLSSVVIPESVTNISELAFSCCENLRSVTIPQGAYCSSTAFEGCGKLWANWYRTLANMSANNSGSSGCSSSEQISLVTTNIVIHYVMQSVPSSAVIPPMATGLVNVVTEVGASNAVAISSEWAEQYPGFTNMFGSDFGAAITKETGKRDGAGNPMFVWQDFVAGTDPTDETDVFRASITFDTITGDPVISWSPELSSAEAAKRTYRIFGKVRLNDPDWTLVDGNAADYNFFKVTVEMK